MASVFVILMTGVVLLAALGSTVQSGVRAYLGGEGLWSKAQKDAILHLDGYVASGSETDWNGYLTELEVILGDSLARQELERPSADMSIVTQGFIAGRNAPEDVDAMAMVFRTFRHISYIDRAITIWTAADAEIDRLREVGTQLRTAVLAGERRTVESLAADLYASNIRLTALERDFSQTLGEGARWVQGVFFYLTAFVVVLLVLITAAMGRFTFRRLRASDLAAAETWRASEARLRLLLEHLPGIVWTTNQQLTITSLSGDGLARLGIDDPSRVGQSIDAVFEDASEAEAYTLVHRKALDGVGGGSYRATFVGRIFQVHVEPLTVDGRVIGLIGIALDLTDRLELEARLERSTRLESIGRLAGGVAHDFNNLLTAITGYSDLLVSALPDGEERHDAEEIRRAAKRATDLTSQLLAFGRRSVLKPELISPNAVIDEMRNMVRRLIGAAIAIEFDLDPTIPHVLADPGQLEQVILNLAVNARDAMPDGGRLTIATRVVRAEADSVGAAPSRVTISVSDTGVGMDEVTRARIFEPFFTTKDHGKGTGLGLSTAYGIVGQSGGSMRVVSEIGTGTTFTISLPAATGILAPPEVLPARAVTQTSDAGSQRGNSVLVEFAGPPSLSGTSRPATGSGPTILLAEDEPAVRALVRHVLSTAGYRVITAVDGQEALELAADLSSLDLLLTDVMMPRLNGPDLADRLRERWPEQPILFMSGFTADVLGQRRVHSPEIGLLLKPFTTSELVERVAQVLAATTSADTRGPAVA